MKNAKRTLIISLVVIALLGATPAFAQWWVGVWDGTGTGSCDDDYIKIHPWLSWQGQILLARPGVFNGEWQDSISAVTGTFYTEFCGADPCSTWASFRGIWNWIDPSSGDTVRGGPADFVLWNAATDYLTGSWDADFFPDDGVPRTISGSK